MIILRQATPSNVGEFKKLKEKYINDKNKFLRDCGRLEVVATPSISEICEELCDDITSTYFLEKDGRTIGYTQFYGDMTDGIHSLCVSAIFIDMGLCRSFLHEMVIDQLKCQTLDMLVYILIGDGSDSDITDLVIQSYEFMVDDELKRTLGYSAFTNMMRFPVKEFFK